MRRSGRGAYMRGGAASAAMLLWGATALSGCAAATGAEAAIGPSPVVPAVAGSAAPEEEAAPGSSFDAGRFSYRLGAVEWDQDARVRAANLAPPPDADGYGWALIPLTVTNVSDEPAAPGQFAVTLHAAGWSVGDREAEKGVVRMPDAFRSRVLQPGESLTGNLGFRLPDRAASDASCWVGIDVWDRGGRQADAHGFRCAARTRVR